MPTAPMTKANPKLSIIIAVAIIIVIALAFAAFLLIPKLAPIKKQAVSLPVATSTYVTITYFSNQALVETGDGQVTRLDGIINAFTKKTGIAVKRVLPPSSVANYSDIAPYLLGQFQSSSTPLDVTMVDGPWIGMFAPYTLDLMPYFKNRLHDFFPDLIANATLNNKLVAMPYFQDMTVLFYRTDLLAKYGFNAPPATWDELQHMASVIQAGERKNNPNFWGYLWAADPSESLTCTALGLQASYGGGTIIDKNQITVNNPNSIMAFTKARSWIGTISPASILNSNEDDILTTWDNGNAAFMQNWPGSFTPGESSSISGKFQMTALPSGGFKHSGVYGGEYLAIDKRSTHPAEAARFLQYLSSPEVQKQRAIQDLWSPVLPALYSDPDLSQTQPIYNYITSDIFSQGVARPGTAAGNNYAKLDTAYFTDVHDILSGKITAANGMKKLESELTKITGMPAGQP